MQKEYTMKKELQDKLFKDFSKLYRQRKLPMTQTCMCWGIETGSGWFQLIYDLSKAIVKLDDTVEAVQVKEKFGGLRFYVSGGKEETWRKAEELIDEAEDKSLHVCEECGEPGRLRGVGWVVTLCDKCWDIRGIK
jgi:hypothetical protein